MSSIFDGSVKIPSAALDSERIGLPFIGNGTGKESWRGAERRGNLMRLLHFVRNDDSLYDHFFMPFPLILGIQGI
jgi:hypothetical protein